MNAHPDIATLLALRDGEALDAAVAAHAEGCAHCRAELARLRALRDGLRALPPVPPGPELWARVVAAVEPPVQVVARRSRLRLVVAGVAASAAFAASVALWVLQGAPGSTTAPAATPVALASAEPSVGDLKLRSQRLEAVLAALESQPRVTTARSAGTIAELEDGIALVDYQLAQVEPDPRDAALQRALWKKRVELMESLVTVRYAGERADSI
jgi:anti-sigma factor RsiW